MNSAAFSMPTDPRLSGCPGWCTDHRDEQAPEFVSHGTAVAVVGVADGSIAVDVIRHDLGDINGEPLVQVVLSGASGFSDVEQLTRSQAEHLRDALTLAIEVSA